MIKYRTNNQTDSTFVGQSFDKFKPVYRLNKVTGVLEETDEVIDIQEVVNSCKDMALNAVLERFLPSSIVGEDVAIVAKMQDDVDKMRDVLSLAEEYRDKYNLSDSLSTQEIFDTISKKSIELKEKIEEIKKNDEKKENE